MLDGKWTLGRRCFLGLAAMPLVGVLAGCGGTADERERDAAAAVQRFETALNSKDARALCEELAPGTRSELVDAQQRPCVEAITDQDLPPAGETRAIDVYGRQARVVAEGDTLFLSQFGAGWKVVAAGCRPEPGRPYQCAVKGG
ncbi:hypothetical protein [Streptomyces chryseus]